MKLTLDRLDLKLEHSNINCSKTRFEHFQPHIQAAIIAADGATFQEYDGSNYNAIHAPDSGSSTPFLNCDSGFEPEGVVRPKGLVA